MGYDASLSRLLTQVVLTSVDHPLMKNLDTLQRFWLNACHSLKASLSNGR
jgi:hypothetical protein